MDEKRLYRIVCGRMDSGLGCILCQKKEADRAEKMVVAAESAYNQLELTEEQKAVIDSYIDAIEKSEMEYNILTYQRAVKDTLQFLAEDREDGIFMDAVDKIFDNFKALYDAYEDLPETLEAVNNMFQYLKGKGIGMEEMEPYAVAVISECERQGFLYGFRYAASLFLDSTLHSTAEEIKSEE